MQPTQPGLLQGLPEDVLVQPLELDVHLQGVDAGGCAGHLEVHVAQEVLNALNVAEDGIAAVVVGNQAHGDAGHRALHGHTGVHQRHAGAADAAHGSAAVGAEYLGNHPNGVGELGFGGQRGQDCPLCQGPVADFPAAGGTHPSGLAHRVRREVVVVHELLGIVGRQGVQGLLHVQGAQGSCRQHLGLAPGEETRAVGSRQYAYLAGDGADFRQAAAVGPYAQVQDAAAYLALDHVLEPFGHLVLAEFFGQLLGDLFFNPVQALVPFRLEGVLLQDFGDAAVDDGLDLVVQSFLFLGFGRNLVLGLADLGHQFVNQFNGDQVGIEGLLDTFQDNLFRYLVGPGLHHHDGVAGAGHHHVQLTFGNFGVGGVHNEPAVVVGDAAGADGTGEGQVGNGQGRRGADHAQDFRGILHVGGKDGEDDLDFVVQSLGEEGANGAVGEAGGEDGFLAGAPLPSEEAARNLARGI